MRTDLAAGCLERDVRAIARLISRLEDGDKKAFDALNKLKASSGTAHVIGVTGPPGSGKSTLVDKMIGIFRSKGLRVSVLAVDPSSPFSGGAILGDRLRMQGHATDPDVFIRSLASRGHLGGLSRATAASVRVLEAAGYDIVMIETVGVGQSEIDIVRVADTVVLVSVPGLGDEIQIIKAGIMEIGDIFVVNKADRDGADRVVREIRAMLETQAMLRHGNTVPSGPDTLAGRASEVFHHGATAVAETVSLSSSNSEQSSTWQSFPQQSPAQLFALPPVLKTVAETGEGVAELVDAALEHHRAAITNGTLKDQRLRSIESQLVDIVSWEARNFLYATEPSGLVTELARKVYNREIDIFSAAEVLFTVLFKKGEKP
jgi:LAO/AO transport system kinase